MNKQYRLAKREDFNKVYRFGKSFANQQLVLYILPKPQRENFRIGVSVSKKIGNAVVRNRLRRVMKEIIRLHKNSIAFSADFILIARKPILNLSYTEVENCIIHVLKKASLYKKIKE